MYNEIILILCGINMGHNLQAINLVIVCTHFFFHVSVLSKRSRIAYCVCINIWFAPPLRSLIYVDPTVSLICGWFRNCMCHILFFMALGSNPLLLPVKRCFSFEQIRQVLEGGCRYRYFSFIEIYEVIFVCVFIQKKPKCFMSIR